MPPQLLSSSEDGSVDHNNDAVDSDTDTISITSTRATPEREEYPVEKILEEVTDDDGLSCYLVKWEGYNIERSTWEPQSNIQDLDEILFSWETQKLRRARGLSPPFDLDAFEAKVAAVQDAKKERQERRKAKRLRLGLPMSETPSGTDNAETVGKGEQYGNASVLDVIGESEDTDGDPMNVVADSNSDSEEEDSQYESSYLGQNPSQRRTRRATESEMAGFIVDDDVEDDETFKVKRGRRMKSTKPAEPSVESDPGLSDDSLITELKKAKRHKRVSRYFQDN
jgi:hypothetical protein